MIDRSTEPTKRSDGTASVRRDDRTDYDRGEYPSYRLTLETQCPNCRAGDPSYRNVLEHEPCGCVRPREAFGDDGGCPECGGVDETTVLARQYTCPSCGSSFDTPAYRLSARGRSTPASDASSLERTPRVAADGGADAGSGDAGRTRTAERDVAVSTDGRGD